MSEVTCNGSCCAVFTLKNPLADHYGEQIIDMAIPLTREEAEARRIEFGGDPFAPPVESDWTYYTCSHWDEKTRLCGIYENRPTMCRDYPYDTKCEHPGCTHCPTEDIIEKWRAQRAKGNEVGGGTPIPAAEVA